MNQLPEKVQQKLNNFVDKVTDIWNDRDQIRKIFAPDLTPHEFDYFISMGLSLQANPYTREIFAVKYGTQPATIIVARDLYRRKAEEQELYNGHFQEAVYPGEPFSLIHDEQHRVIGVNHQLDMEKRYADPNALPYGAYCIVYKKGMVPFYVFVAFREYELSGARNEYDKNKQKTGNKIKNEFWSTRPETQIKKVAESQGLRGAFQGVFRGTYTTDEYQHMKDQIVNEISAEFEDVTESESLKDRILNRTQKTVPEQPATPEPQKESEKKPVKQPKKVTDAMLEDMKEYCYIGQEKVVTTNMKNYSFTDEQKLELSIVIEQSKKVNELKSIADELGFTLQELTDNAEVTGLESLKRMNPDQFNSIYDETKSRIGTK